MKHIIDQDRENIYPITEGAVFYSVVNKTNGVYYGINLKMDDKMLGTFDTPAEIMGEIKRILESREETYSVTGFSQGGFAEW